MWHQSVAKARNWLPLYAAAKSERRRRLWLLKSGAKVTASAIIDTGGRRGEGGVTHGEDALKMKGAASGAAKSAAEGAGCCRTKYEIFMRRRENVTKCWR